MLTSSWRRPVVVLAMALAPALGSCSSGGSLASETARWLRTAGRFDDSPEHIACLEDAMHEELSPDELGQWLAEDPEGITVEEVQALPHAIDVADRCRHLTG